MEENIALPAIPDGTTGLVHPQYPPEVIAYARCRSILGDTYAAIERKIPLEFPGQHPSHWSVRYWCLHVSSEDIDAGAVREIAITREAHRRVLEQIDKLSGVQAAVVAGIMTDKTIARARLGFLAAQLKDRTDTQLADDVEQAMH